MNAVKRAPAADLPRAPFYILQHFQHDIFYFAALYFLLFNAIFLLYYSVFSYRLQGFRCEISFKRHFLAGLLFGCNPHSASAKSAHFQNRSRAFFGTYQTTRAFVVIDHGQIILHGDRTLRTQSGAKPAAQAPAGTSVFHRPALAGIAARDEHFRVLGNTVEQPFRTNLFARPAGSAKRSFHLCAAVFDFN